MLHLLIAETLQRIMHAQNISAIQLAKRAGVKPSFLYDVLSGKSTNPSIVKLVQVSKVLKINVSQLVDEHFPEPPALEASYLRDKVAQPFFEEYVAISSVLLHASWKEGALITLEEEGKPYYFRREWIRDRLVVSPNDLRMIVVQGDSMAPTLTAHDAILVDTTKTSPTPPGIFVIYDGLGLAVKRLEFVSGGKKPVVRVISDNPHYATYERELPGLTILGRIVWFAREL